MSYFLKKLLFCALFFACIFENNVQANGLTVTGVSYAGSGATSEVRFSLGWNNSWYTANTPFNWDAAWVFIKYRICGADPTVAWSHALINTTTSVHTLPGFQPTSSDGATIPGIDASPNNTGVMLRRNALGIYPSVVAAQCTLLLAAPTQFTAGTLYDVKVFGIEHVFIPQGTFWIGDQSLNTGNITQNSNGSYRSIQITSEAVIPALTSATGGINVNTLGYTANLPAAFPKGYKPFYMMKYEITHGQYASFLNTITANSQTARYPGNALASRYALTSGNPAPDTYGTTRTDRALNWIGWMDISCYLDWAALRPLTELEYEKACRGTNPSVTWEYAWGSRTIVEAKTISTTVPTENGTEVILDPNANCHYNAGGLIGGDGSDGPIRGGIFANGTTTTRQQTGAGYYGNMELSGNLWEHYVMTTTNNTYDGAWGDGVINEAVGLHNQATWPANNLNYAGQAIAGSNNVVSLRGGDWANAAASSCVSDRSCFYSGYCDRNSNRGGRGGR